MKMKRKKVLCAAALTALIAAIAVSLYKAHQAW